MRRCTIYRRVAAAAVRPTAAAAYPPRRPPTLRRGLYGITSDPFSHIIFYILLLLYYIICKQTVCRRRPLWCRRCSKVPINYYNIYIGYRSLSLSGHSYHHRCMRISLKFFSSAYFYNNIFLSPSRARVYNILLYTYIIPPDDLWTRVHTRCYKPSCEYIYVYAICVFRVAERIYIYYLAKYIFLH